MTPVTEVLIDPRETQGIVYLDLRGRGSSVGRPFIANLLRRKVGSFLWAGGSGQHFDFVRVFLLYLPKSDRVLLIDLVLVSLSFRILLLRPP